MRVVPELYCTNIKDNIDFFVGLLGFSIKYARESEEFVYLTRDGVDLMLEGLSGDSRKWLIGDLERPFGRGVNFQWDVSGISELYSKVRSLSPGSIYLPLETKSYAVNERHIEQRQFIVQSPDGYLFRFCEELL
ncbi:MAG: VOC family protein [Chloroflexota bacterium]